MSPLATAMTLIFRYLRCPRSLRARYGSVLRRGRVPFPDGKGFSRGLRTPLNLSKEAKAMKGMKRRAMRKKKAAAAEEAPMKAMRRK